MDLGRPTSSVFLNPPLPSVLNPAAALEIVGHLMPYDRFWCYMMDASYSSGQNNSLTKEIKYLKYKLDRFLMENRLIFKFIYFIINRKYDMNLLIMGKLLYFSKIYFLQKKKPKMLMNI